MLDALPTAPLPEGVLLQPMIVSSSEADVNHFPMLSCNESALDIVLPVGTVLGNLCSVDSVVGSSVRLLLRFHSF